MIYLDFYIDQNLHIIFIFVIRSHKIKSTSLKLVHCYVKYITSQRDTKLVINNEYDKISMSHKMSEDPNVENLKNVK